jgi:hypothetical protein
LNCWVAPFFPLNLSYFPFLSFDFAALLSNWWICDECAYWFHFITDGYISDNKVNIHY